MDEVKSLLFGMPGFEVIGARENANGVLEVDVETIDPALGCPSCGTPAGGSRGRPKVKLRDVNSAGRMVLVWWAKRRHLCPDPDCGRYSFTEQHPAVGPRRRTTFRRRNWIADQVSVTAEN